MRYFIRHYALRLGMGESAPWVVEDELVKKFNLPSKFSDFLLDPHKVSLVISFCCSLFKSVFKCCMFLTHLPVYISSS